ncbi:hypothetical protein KIN20_031716 [Parelaphostrongylus tenuis]|uniref:Uncharacterized protein n=1 Tax=Parelaphostrongylus tenuis TaxID=148309 RepID=A0AAD5WHF7_PARTN|nr:hypothetical protein KIN20_031716 [Parelaphostrongylus tenuis]
MTASYYLCIGVELVQTSKNSAHCPAQWTDYASIARQSSIRRPHSSAVMPLPGRYVSGLRAFREESSTSSEPYALH